LQLLEQSKLAQLGEMIGNIAHQWRQPLSVISAIATGMEVKLDYNMIDEKELRKNLQILNDTAQHLSRTIDQFRNFAKEERVESIVSVTDRIEEALKIVDPGLKYLNIKVFNNCKEELKIKVVKGELAQVLINILNNARDVLKNKNDDRWIKIECLKKDENVIITVEDNGGGIPKEIKNRIFEPYFTTKHKSQGTGLGLYMSKKIIEQNNNGKLFVKNTKNGAKFYIVLPLA